MNKKSADLPDNQEIRTFYLMEKMDSGEITMKNRFRPGRKTLKTILIVCVAAVISTAAGLGIYIHIADTGTLGRKISVSHLDVSKLTVDEAAQKIRTDFENRKVIFSEDGKQVYETTLQNLGYSLDETTLKNVLTDIGKERAANRKIIAAPVNYTIPYQLRKDEAREKAALSASNFGSQERSASVDAVISYDEQKKEYTVASEVQGNQIDEAALLTRLNKTLEADFEENLLGDGLTFTMTTDVYQQPVKADSDEIQTKLNELNTRLSTYRGTALTYTFGDSTESLEPSVVDSWIKIDGENISIDQDAAKSYVENLAAKYNTIYVPRTFHTTLNGDVTVSGNEYGFQIDQDKELAQLLDDIENGRTVSRDPVYAISGMQRNGTDDLAGSYIEVSLDNQHLWLYKDGVLITETDIVSGAPTPERETYRGAWPIAYKASPYSLTSDVYGYTTNVTYWMPFVYGQGLHDASWQSSFGGNRYKTGAGSHGCINLPKDQAAIIYENIDGGYPIIIY